MSFLDISKRKKEYHCQNCGTKLVRIVKITERQTLTKSEIRICNNPKCFGFINVKKLKSWEIFKHYGTNKKFKRQNRPEYNPNLSRAPRVGGNT